MDKEITAGFLGHVPVIVRRGLTRHAADELPLCSARQRLMPTVANKEGARDDKHDTKMPGAPVGSVFHARRSEFGSCSNCSGDR
jgi:hypothetical protein